MRALCWYGKEDVRVETVPDPVIENPGDIIIKITSTAICGSDLHLYDGFMPTMEKGDILGHEPMGEVIEVGSAVKNLKVGDRVVVPFTIACGTCFFCKKELYSCCDTVWSCLVWPWPVSCWACGGLFTIAAIMARLIGTRSRNARR